MYLILDSMWLATEELNLGVVANPCGVKAALDARKASMWLLVPVLVTRPWFPALHHQVAVMRAALLQWRHAALKLECLEVYVVVLWTLLLANLDGPVMWCLWLIFLASLQYWVEPYPVFSWMPRSPLTLTCC